MKAHIAGSSYVYKTSQAKAIRNSNIMDMYACYQIAIALALKKLYGFGNKRIRDAFFCIGEAMDTFHSYASLSPNKISRHGYDDIGTGQEKLFRMANSRNIDTDYLKVTHCNTPSAQQMDKPDVCGIYYIFRLCVAIGLNDKCGFGNSRIKQVFDYTNEVFREFDKASHASDEMKALGYNDRDIGKKHLLKMAEEEGIDLYESAGITFTDYRTE